MEACTDFDKGLPRFPFRSWQIHAHAEELGFRDFSSLFLVKENRRQPGNSACCTFLEVSLTSRVFAMGRTKRKWGAMLNLESGGRSELFYEDSPEATIRAAVNRLLSDQDEGMGLV